MAALTVMSDLNHRYSLPPDEERFIDIGPLHGKHGPADDALACEHARGFVIAPISLGDAGIVGAGDDDGFVVDEPDEGPCFRDRIIVQHLALLKHGEAGRSRPEAAELGGAPHVLALVGSLLTAESDARFGVRPAVVMVRDRDVQSLAGRRRSPYCEGASEMQDVGAPNPFRHGVGGPGNFEVAHGPEGLKLQHHIAALHISGSSKHRFAARIVKPFIESPYFGAWPN